MLYCTLWTILFFGINVAEPRYKTMNDTAAGLYNQKSQKCCLGTVHANIKPDYQKCCGSNVYDTSKQLCCNGTVFEFTPASACCGSAAVNTDKSICCEEQKVDVPQADTNLINYARCCGPNLYYDSRTQTCCNTGSGKKILEGQNKLCCGEAVYDENTQVCCASSKNKTTTFKVIPKGNHQAMFCSKTKFCGEMSYDENSQLCCYDADQQSLIVVPKTDPNQWGCCGTEPYDGEKQLCCYPTMKLVTRRNMLDYECCGNLSFNSAKQQCCGDRLINIVGSSDVCCGDAEIYDPMTKICCTKYNDNGKLESRVIADNPDFRLSCCGLETYDLLKQMCCGTTLIPYSQNSLCCGNKTYDLTKEICCSETVFTKKSNQDTCCYYGTTDAKGEVSIFSPHPFTGHSDFSFY